MRITDWKLPLALCLSIASSVLTIHAQEDVYLINKGQLMRWGLDMKTLKRIPMPLRVPMPAELTTMASFAVNRRSEAYAVTGRDGQIFQTDGKTARSVYQHSDPIAQIAFGRSNDLLYFSVAKPSLTREEIRAARERGEPIARITAGRLYTLNLRDSRIEQRATILHAAVGGTWTGTFTVDLSDRVYLATPAGRVYELRDGSLFLQYENAADTILGLSYEVNALLFVTGGPEVYELRGPTARTAVLNRPTNAWSHVSYHSFPFSDEPSGEPCELTVSATGEATGVDQLFPIIRGPNLSWVSAAVDGNGGKTGRGLFRYFVLKGIYWVRMDMKGDTGKSARPSEQRVDCTGARASAQFTFERLTPRECRREDRCASPGAPAARRRPPPPPP